MLGWTRCAAGLMLAALGSLAVPGCAGYAPGGRLTSLERTAYAYGSALGRGEFERAAFVAGLELSDKSELEKYRQVRVLGYESAPLEATPDGSHARQVARIEYTLTGSVRVHRIEDVQTWHYDEAGGRWLLSSGLPDFFGAR